MTETQVTPKDFFLWLGAMAAFYGAITAFLALLFEYINYAFPDELAGYADPYSGAVRFSMAALLVLSPLALGLIYLIRKSIFEAPAKKDLWVRRWAIMLTLFIAGATVAIDLITLVNTFLGGEITTRFALKVLVVLLVAVAVFLHFLAEMRGYWFKHPKKAHLVAVAALVASLLTIGSGFLVIGTPGDARLIRYDEQKVSDLQNLQYQILTYYQQKEELPASLDELSDPLSGMSVPLDPQSKEAYRYERMGELSFTICAVFNKESRDLAGRGSYPTRDIAHPSMGGGVDENWAHGVGDTCYERTIDPERYPPFAKPL